MNLWKGIKTQIKNPTLSSGASFRLYRLPKIILGRDRRQESCRRTLDGQSSWRSESSHHDVE